MRYLVVQLRFGFRNGLPIPSRHFQVSAVGSSCEAAAVHAGRVELLDTVEEGWDLLR